MFTKLETFLVLCRTMNYRITAEQLHLTQPAVTKQIQSLERLYDAKLFNYQGGKLEKTDKCHILEEYASSLQYTYRELENRMQQAENPPLRIGATKTIGDYVLGEDIAKFLSLSENSLSLVVDNTERLLNMLDANQLDFVAIEGLFNKRKYDYELLREEPFVGICSKDHEFSGRLIATEELLEQTIIVREDGSGTRNILERQLMSLGYDLGAFHKKTSISSFKLIREMVLNHLGISFAYQAVVGGDDRFGTFSVDHITAAHEFNVVYLKNTNAGKLADKFLNKAD
ncbi:MAG: LysR family transcriptional regulator [Clostridiales bacterium]|nr:LysR family transcriptional regulator [Clostridiales bacterium]